MVLLPQIILPAGDLEGDQPHCHRDKSLQHSPGRGIGKDGPKRHRTKPCVSPDDRTTIAANHNADNAIAATNGRT